MIAFADLFRRLRVERNGATLVEFALVAPLFLATIMGILGLALFMFQAYNFDNAMRSAVRDVLIAELRDAGSIEAEIDATLADAGFDDTVTNIDVEKLDDNESVAHVSVIYDFAPGAPFGLAKTLSHRFDADIPISTGFF